MNLSLERLLFDPTDPSVGPNVGSYVRAGDDGTLIGHVSDALKVNLSNASIAVTATDLDIRDLTHVSDSVKIGDGTDFLAVNADGSINISAISGNVTVVATDFDIRDLSHTQDSIKIGDGTDFLAVNADGSINVNLTDDGIADDAADSGNPFKVGSRAFGGAALSAISATGDRADLLSDMYRRVFINDAANVGSLAGAVSVTDSAAVALPTSALAGRVKMLIQNKGNKKIYIGHSGVTSVNGIEMEKGTSMSLEAGQYNPIYAIAETGATVDVRVLQLA